MSDFIMLVGIPGCGKSTYTKNHFINDNTVILSSDELRIKFGFDPGCGNSVVFPEMLKRSKAALLSGKNVVYDATNLSRKNRIAVLAEVKKYCDRRVCILFIEPVDVCKKRNKQREGFAVVPDYVIDNMVKTFNVPMECEGFDEIKLVQTEKSSVTFDDLLEKAKGFEQDNSHHNLDLYDHLVKTKNNLFKLLGVIHVLPDDMYEASLYHDLGKLYTKTFINPRGIKTTEAHYYNHENLGAYLYLVIVLGFVTSERELKSKLETAALINWHMRPYLEMSEEKRKREYEMFGEKFVKKLLILHVADSLAH